MPRHGHKYGGPVPDNLAHHETRHGIRLRANKLTVTLRQLAKTDDAVSAYLRKRVSESARWDAFMASRGWYYGKTCPRCHSTRHRVYDTFCLDCAIRRRPLLLTKSNRVASWPQAQRSRDGWLAIKDAERRERAGEHESATFGPFEAVRRPTGLLAVSAPSIGWRTDDLRTLSFETIHNLIARYPDMLRLLEWAGWA